MRLMGLQAIYRAPRTSDPHPEHRVYPPFDRLALPCTHLVRMNLVLRGNLLQRPVAPKRFQCHLRFQITRKPDNCPIFRGHLTLPWSRINLSKRTGRSEISAGTGV